MSFFTLQKGHSWLKKKAKGSYLALPGFRHRVTELRLLSFLGFLQLHSLSVSLSAGIANISLHILIGIIGFDGTTETLNPHARKYVIFLGIKNS